MFPQMDTDALRNLTVGGFEVAATLAHLADLAGLTLNLAAGRRLQQQRPPKDEPGEGESLQGSASVSALGGVRPGRQLLSPGSTCCRWTPNTTCSPSVDECTGLHEYLEKATTTHVFHDVNMCLGDDPAKWAWQFDGTTSGTTLSGRHVVTGATEVVEVPTPLKVTHAANCGSTAPTLSLQMDTVALRSLRVGGYDVAQELTRLTTPPPSPPPTNP